MKSRKAIIFEAQRVVSQLQSFAGERLDGYCIVGFVAGTNEPCVIRPPCDAKAFLAVNQLLIAALNTQPERA